MENSQRIGRAAVEAAFGQAGFRLESADEIRTEFREYEEERSQRVSDSLLRLARLQRRSAEVIDRFGGDKYDLWEASLHWLAYLLLGKLEPVAYVLRLPWQRLVSFRLASETLSRAQPTARPA
jgi:hypothetical protein